MIVRFIDIGGIHVHHCLSFHFINEKKNKLKKKQAIWLSYQILQYVYKTRNEESFFQIDLKNNIAPYNPKCS